MFSERDTDDLALQAQEREAERELVAVVLDLFEHRFEREEQLPWAIVAQCKRLAAIKARRAALLDGGGGREGE